jgi:transcriptional regulator with XRE-family HTH domain
VLAVAPSSLASAVRERRRQLGLSQSALAQRSDVAVATIRKLEQGRIAAPRYATVYSLSRALDLTPTSDPIS